MKKRFPLIFALILAILILAVPLRPPPAEGFAWRQFSELPVLVNGRIKPLDTVARVSLLALRGKQSVKLEDARLSAIEWLAEVLYAPATADTRPVFLITDPDVLAIFGWQQDKEKFFAFEQLRPHLAEVDKQARLANDVPAEQRTRFQRHILELYNRLLLYQRLKNSLQPEDSPDFARELELFASALKPGIEALEARSREESFDNRAFDLFMTFAARYRDMSEQAYLRVVPPHQPQTEQQRSEWLTIGDALLHATAFGEIDPVVRAYAEAGRAYRAGDETGFNAAVAEITTLTADGYERELRKARHEGFFNRYQPFMSATVLYILAFLLACASWLSSGDTLRRTAWSTLVLAFLIHTSGLAFRVYLQGYAPVTNLYSSALGVGWGAVALGLAMEAVFRNGLGSAASGIFGFATLIIAHNLALASGSDTMEMMRAVLDNNFWLATHVTVITIGYSTTFLAGFLALFYIVMGAFTGWLDKPWITRPDGTVETNASALNRMVYGVLCFAVLFSFVGTVLGGIWADQSWGRFWGWDPKENGAALIVVWNAIILHARWGRYIGERGLMIMAVFGNIVTAWSWFGTNMLGIGLHSYGFMDAAFFWLMAFVASQLAIMLLGALSPRIAARVQKNAPASG
ncbi:MAG: cytochrome C biogenesis protein [Verrucomicrobia bacterium]|nr:MAG: cytochrome C biogenesis protein [Verrucomicrobiota bacterium]